MIAVYLNYFTCSLCFLVIIPDSATHGTKISVRVSKPLSFIPDVSMFFTRRKWCSLVKISNLLESFMQNILWPDWSRWELRWLIFSAQPSKVKSVRYEMFSILRSADKNWGSNSNSHFKVDPPVFSSSRLSRTVNEPRWLMTIMESVPHISLILVGTSGLH